MKSREETARFIESQMAFDHHCRRDKKDRVHYGWQELRELMDFIYGGEPEGKNQCLADNRESSGDKD